MAVSFALFTANNKILFAFWSTSCNKRFIRATKVNLSDREKNHCLREFNWSSKHIWKFSSNLNEIFQLLIVGIKIVIFKKSKLTHPIYASIFRIALRFGGNYFDSFKSVETNVITTKMQPRAEITWVNSRMWQLALLTVVTSRFNFLDAFVFNLNINLEFFLSKM